VVFDRVTIRVSNLEASRRFYALADAPPSLVVEDGGEPTQRLHIAFGVPNRDSVDEAVRHDNSRPGGIDHLWLRTGDLGSAWI